MKKNSFVEGTFIATLAIILVKVLGVLYVMPFYRIVGETGGTLYSYAYNVYNLFLNISTAGIPIAISKIISEYNALDMLEAKERAYKIGKRIIMLISIIIFFIMFIFSKEIAMLIIGKTTGGSTINDISFVIKSVSFCLLVVPLLSVDRGYLQGHKHITPTSISQVIEQVVRIAVILFGSYIVISVLNKSVTLGVGLAVFGAFVGALFSFIYIRLTIVRHKKELVSKKTKKDKVANKEIVKKIITYALPLIIVSIVNDIYFITDQSLVIRTLYKLGYSGSDAQTISSIVSTWAPKICMIINSIAIGMSVSLIPHMTDTFTKKDMEKTNRYFNDSISIILVVAFPLTIGLSYLSRLIYPIFYSYSVYGPLILKYTAVSALLSTLFIAISSSLQSLNRFKTVYISTIVGLLLNALLDIPLMMLFNYFKLDAYYGAIAASIIGYSVSILIAFISLRKAFNFKYNSITKSLFKTVLSSLAMLIVLFILSLFVKIDNYSFIVNILKTLLFTLVGAIIYIIIGFKTKLFEETFGKEFLNKILRRK